MAQRHEVFKSGGKRIVEMGMTIPATLVFAALFIISCRLLYEDIRTSIWGYESLPTNKTADIAVFVALFFVLLQMGSTYMAVALGLDHDNTNDNWAKFFGGLVLLGILFDSITDIAYRISGNVSVEAVIAALFETFVIYTIGSELALTISISVLIVLVPFFVAAVVKLVHDTLKAIGSKDEAEDRQPPVGPRNR
jgi:hypothetical protein